MIVLGIDPGLTKENPTAIAVVDTDAMSIIHCHDVYAPARTDWTERLALVVTSLQVTVANMSSIELVCYEQPFLGKNVQSTIKLAHICGVAYTLGRPCQTVSPIEAKIALTRNRKASKDDMIMMAKRVFNTTCTKDQADAAGVALAGEAIYRRAQYAV